MKHIKPMDACQECFQPFIVHNENRIKGKFPEFKDMDDKKVVGVLCPPKEGYWCNDCETFHPNEYPCPKAWDIILKIEETNG